MSSYCNSFYVKKFAKPLHCLIVQIPHLPVCHAKHLCHFSSVQILIVYKNDNISLILRQLFQCAGKLLQCFLVQKRIIRFFCGIYCVLYQLNYRMVTLYLKIITNRIARYGIDPCGKRSLGFIVFIKIAIHFQKYGMNNVLYFGLVVYFGADKAEDLITVLRILNAESIYNSQLCSFF